MTSKTKPESKIEDYLKTKKNLIDNHLKQLLCEYFFSKEEDELQDAIKYTLLNGGKRIRGILCLATYETIKDHINNKDDFIQDSLTTACAIELIHTMSLIHDDLPCMDNDDLRRGKPSCHKAFSESTAILTGDAMLSLAFYLIAEHTNNISATQKIEIIKILSSIFSFGLVPGQILDLSLSGKKDTTTKTIEKVSRLKTAELIKGSVLSGAVIALKNEMHIETNKYILEKLANWGTEIGLAFQIIDDILDITSDSKTLGKTSGKDKEQDKHNYPLLYGIEKAKEAVQKHTENANSILGSLKIKSRLMYQITEYIVNRTY